MIAYHDTWPETPRLLWRIRHEPISGRGWHVSQRACVSCGHAFTKGHFRAHLRSAAHRANRGWWA